MKRILGLLCLLLVSCNENRIDKETIVGIVPYEEMSDSKVLLLKNAIQEYYDVTVKELPKRELPRSAFIDIKSPRYRADSLIAIQERNKQADINYVIGLTEKDISTTKYEKDGSVKKPAWKYNDFGIMGLAYCPGKSCIVSGYRLNHKDKEIYFGRFKKVMIHEFGHNLGLPHCPDKKCVMTDAVESIKTIDNAKPELCIECKKKIK